MKLGCARFDLIVGGAGARKLLERVHTAESSTPFGLTVGGWDTR